MIHWLDHLPLGTGLPMGGDYLGYKPFGWQYDYYYKKACQVEIENHLAEGKTYVFDLYKDLYKLKIGRLVPMSEWELAYPTLFSPKQPCPTSYRSCSWFNLSDAKFRAICRSSLWRGG